MSSSTPKKKIAGRKARVNPDPVWSKRHDQLARLLKRGTAVRLGPNALQWHRELVRASKKEHDAAMRKEELRAQLTKALGRAKLGVLPQDAGFYALRVEHREEYTVEAHKCKVLRYNRRFEG
jgi:hypothetical protein